MWNLVLLLIVFVQIILGTSVRGQIDTIADQLSNLNRSGWIEQLNIYFYIHRSFSLVVAALTIYLFFKTKYKPKASSLFLKTVYVILLEIAVGVVLTYADFPAAAQPIHLLLSSILVAIIFNNYLRFKTFCK
jgi:cytochrome c oxidase assembly protein subunit 15